MKPTQFALPVSGQDSGQDPGHDGSAEAASRRVAALAAPAKALSDEAAFAPYRTEGEFGFGKTYWRTIEERQNGAPIPDLQNEFPPGAAQPPTGFARREFLQLTAASLALAGLTACSEKPVEKVLPYTKTPDGLTPGNPLHFATAYPSVGGHALGLLVTSWEGRPTKIEGNPDHPSSLGATGLSEQALSLQLYDPQRARQIKFKGAGKAWRALRETLTQDAAGKLDATGGAGLRFLVEPSTSPLELSLRQAVLKRFPKAKFYSAAALDRDGALAGAELAFGQAAEVDYDLEKADVVVSLDADFLAAAAENLRHTRQFANRRDPKHAAGMNRLYMVEPRMTVTGGMADHRLRLRGAEVESVAIALAEKLGLLSAGPKSPLSGEADKFVTAVAKDLKSKPGRSVVIAGSHQSALTNALAHVINGSLGNLHQTVRFFAPVNHDNRSGGASWKALVDEMNAGAVDTLIITAWNPAYHAPADVDFVSAVSNVRNSVYLGLFEDETSIRTSWFVPKSHPLESWGDIRAKDGTVSIIQPLIQPLFNGVGTVDLLSIFVLGDERRVHEQLKGLHAQDHKPVGTKGLDAKGLDFDGTWDTYLSAGMIPGTASAPLYLSLKSAAVEQAASDARAPDTQGYELNFVRDYKVADGRYGNVTWLQEIPDPITKITWDNAALISPAAAKELGVEQNDVIRIETGGRAVEAPVFVVPGYADRSIALPLGYGRLGAEWVAAEVGVNAYALRTSAAPWYVGGVKVTKTDKTFRLSTTQVHWSQEGRQIALSQSVEEFKKKPEAEEQRRPTPTIFNMVDYSKETYRWALNVDLSRCTGCSACVIACQSENNIPVVGKEQVFRSREMHWLRIDRYFSGSDADPEMVNQPMMCQHCETAPCEYVCPVNATVHSDEGLNDMVYNRCIGTRYCSNNCPYKVRHFNYLHWNKDKSALERMAMNPDVTVRNRGVMEKCTYCVQRIERTRITSRLEGRGIRDGEIKTACQQVCPTDAIVFGSLGDPESRVSKLHNDERRYDVLHELNTRPRTAYLTRIKNPNPELA